MKRCREKNQHNQNFSKARYPQPGVFFLNWVRLKKYEELSGDTVAAVKARRKKGQWLNGIQCCLGPDRRLWINLPEVEKWVKSQTLYCTENPWQFPLV